MPTVQTNVSLHYMKFDCNIPADAQQIFAPNMQLKSNPKREKKQQHNTIRCRALFNEEGSHSSIKNFFQ